MVRRGLVVSYYFPPQGGGGVQRWVKFIKYLSHWDWQFSVITAPPEPLIPIDESLRKELPPNLNVHQVPEFHRSPSIFRLFSNKLRRSYSMRWLSAFIHITDSRSYWCKMIKPKIDTLLNEEKFDILIFTIPPYSLASLAAEFSTHKNIPVLLDLRDPWTINPYKIYPTPFHRHLDTCREKNAIRTIQLITSAYQSTLDFYQKTISGFSQKKILYIANGYDEADFRDLKKNDSTKNDVFKIGFSGSIYSHLNIPKPLFQAIKILRNVGYKIEVHHFGISVYNIDQMALKFGLNDVYIKHGYLPHSEVLIALMKMDATCLILNESYKNADKTVGGKLYEYLRVKKPIIAIVPEKGEAARTVNQTDSGIVCSSQNPDQIAACIQKLINKDIHLTFKNIEEFDRKKLSEKLRDFIEDNISRF